MTNRLVKQYLKSFMKMASLLKKQKWPVWLKEGGKYKPVRDKLGSSLL